MTGLTEVAQRPSAARSDGYRIECELGAGGMATVYLVQHPPSGVPRQ
jgi:hypothetical protein